MKPGWPDMLDRSGLHFTKEELLAELKKLYPKCVVCGADEHLIPVPHGADGQLYCEEVTDCLNRRNQNQLDKEANMTRESDAELVIAQVKKAVDAYNPGSKLVWVIQYTATVDKRDVIHAVAYNSLDTARKVATELERDKVALFGAQIAGVTIT